MAESIGEQQIDAMALARFAESVAGTGSAGEQLTRRVERITQGAATLQLDQSRACRDSDGCTGMVRQIPVAFAGRTYGTLLVQPDPNDPRQPQIPDTLSQQLAAFCGVLLSLFEAEALLRALSSDLPALPPDALTTRQQEVLELIAHGLDDDAIMAKLCISAKTLRRHCHDLYARLGVHCKVDMLLVAHRHGLISFVAL